MLKSKWWLLCCLLIIFQGSASLQKMNFNLIKLHYRDAFEVKSLLKPMLAPGGKISGSGYTLIIQTTSSNMRQLKLLLRKIDTRPAMLKIMVRSGNLFNRSSSLNKHYISRDLKNSMQTLSLLEGHGAFIATGKELPTVSIIGGVFWPGVLNSYEKIQTGFYIVPYLRGRQAMVQFIFKQENSQQPNSVIDLQNMSTTVMVPLGRWYTISGTNQSSNDEDVYQKNYSSRLSSIVSIKILKLK